MNQNFKKCRADSHFKVKIDKKLLGGLKTNSFKMYLKPLNTTFLFYYILFDLWLKKISGLCLRFFCLWLKKWTNQLLWFQCFKADLLNIDFFKHFFYLTNDFFYLAFSSPFLEKFSLFFFCKVLWRIYPTHILSSSSQGEKVKLTYPSQQFF